MLDSSREKETLVKRAEHEMESGKRERKRSKKARIQVSVLENHSNRDRVQIIHDFQQLIKTVCIILRERERDGE